VKKHIHWNVGAFEIPSQEINNKENAEITHNCNVASLFISIIMLAKKGAQKLPIPLQLYKNPNRSLVLVSSSFIKAKDIFIISVTPHDKLPDALSKTRIQNYR